MKALTLHFSSKKKKKKKVTYSCRWIKEGGPLSPKQGATYRRRGKLTLAKLPRGGTMLGGMAVFVEFLHVEDRVPRKLHHTVLDGGGAHA